MRNWDALEEGGRDCGSRREWQSVQAVCHTLGIESRQVDFVKECVCSSNVYICSNVYISSNYYNLNNIIFSYRFTQPNVGHPGTGTASSPRSSPRTSKVGVAAARCGLGVCFVDAQAKDGHLRSATVAPSLLTCSPSSAQSPSSTSCGRHRHSALCRGAPSHVARPVARCKCHSHPCPADVLAIIGTVAFVELVLILLRPPPPFALCRYVGHTPNPDGLTA